MPSYKNAAERNPLAKGCEGCYFLSNYFGCCNYLIFTDKRRPCPGGEDCTVKTTKLPGEAKRKANWDVDRGKALWEKGATDAEIARSLHVAIETMRSYRRKYWGPPNLKKGEPTGPKPRWDREKGLQLWLSGATDKEVAQDAGVTEAAVAAYRKAHWMHLKDQRADPKAKPKWDTEKAYSLYRKGLPDAAVAKEVGVHPETVRNYRMKHWGAANYSHQVTWDTEKGLELYRQGKSVSEIAREIGVGRNAVEKYAQRHWRGEG